MIYWLYQFGQRTHLLLPPLVFASLMGALSVGGALLSSGDLVRSTLPMAHFVGTTLLFILLPAYQMVAVPKLLALTHKLLDSLQREANPETLAGVRASIKNVPHWRYLLMVIGFLFGLSQNELYVRTMLDTGVYTLLDIVFVLQSAILWVFIVDTIAWRVNVSVAISRFARYLEVELLQHQKFRLIARMATNDVLVVAGAMAFMALQSLDAEFRLWNYQAGFIVGTATAIALFFLPLIGARQNIKARKVKRLQELQLELSKLPQDDIPRLEAHLAHIDRVAAIANWPIDMNLFARIMGYVIIPPIAWIGAALVERAISAL